MLELYHGTTSVCAIKVRLVLAEKGLREGPDWNGRLLNLPAGEQQRPEYLRLNPKGVVPTLVHDGEVIVESSVIATYLDELYPDPPFQPTDALARARMRLWMKEVDDTLHPHCSVLTFATANRKALLKRTAEDLEAYYDRIPDPTLRRLKRESVEQGLAAPQVTQAISDYDAALGRMEATLARQPWLAGEAYSLADICLTPYVNRLEMLGMAGLWEDTRPALTDWLARVRARPPFHTAVTAMMTPADVERFTVPRDEVWAKVRAALDPRESSPSV